MWRHRRHTYIKKKEFSSVTYGKERKGKESRRVCEYKFVRVLEYSETRPSLERSKEQSCFVHSLKLHIAASLNIILRAMRLSTERIIIINYL